MSDEKKSGGPDAPLHDPVPAETPKLLQQELGLDRRAPRPPGGIDLRTTPAMPGPEYANTVLSPKLSTPTQPDRAPVASPFAKTVPSATIPVLAQLQENERLAAERLAAARMPVAPPPARPAAPPSAPSLRQSLGSRPLTPADMVTDPLNAASRVAAAMAQPPRSSGPNEKTDPLGAPDVAGAMAALRARPAPVAAEPPVDTTQVFRTPPGVAPKADAVGPARSAPPGLTPRAPMSDATNVVNLDELNPPVALSSTTVIAPMPTEKPRTTSAEAWPELAPLSEWVPTPTMRSPSPPLPAGVPGGPLIALPVRAPGSPAAAPAATLQSIPVSATLVPPPGRVPVAIPPPPARPMGGAPARPAVDPLARPIPGATARPGAPDLAGRPSAPARPGVDSEARPTAVATALPGVAIPPAAARPGAPLDSAWRPLSRAAVDAEGRPVSPAAARPGIDPAPSISPAARPSIAPGDPAARSIPSARVDADGRTISPAAARPAMAPGVDPAGRSLPSARPGVESEGHSISSATARPNSPATARPDAAPAYEPGMSSTALRPGIAALRSPSGVSNPRPSVPGPGPLPPPDLTPPMPRTPARSSAETRPSMPATRPVVSAGNAELPEPARPSHADVTRATMRPGPADSGGIPPADRQSEWIVARQPDVTPPMAQPGVPGRPSEADVTRAVPRPGPPDARSSTPPQHPVAAGMPDVTASVPRTAVAARRALSGAFEETSGELDHTPAVSRPAPLRASVDGDAPLPDLTPAEPRSPPRTAAASEHPATRIPLETVADFRSPVVSAPFKPIPATTQIVPPSEAGWSGAVSHTVPQMAAVGARDVPTSPDRAPVPAPSVTPPIPAPTRVEPARAMTPPPAPSAPPPAPSYVELPPAMARPRPLGPEFATTQPGIPGPYSKARGHDAAFAEAAQQVSRETAASQNDLAPAELEAVELNQVLATVASTWRRVLSWVIDGVVVAGMVGALFYVALELVGHKAVPPSLHGADALLFRLKPIALPGAALGALLAVLYTTLFAALKGRTLGRLFLGIRLVDSSGHPPGFGRSFLRAILSLFSFGLCLAGFWLALFDRHGQTLHDKLTRTFVIRPV